MPPMPQDYVAVVNPATGLPIQVYVALVDGSGNFVVPTTPDGWTPASETWTFASATTLTVPNGALYQKGDRLKLTQSGSVAYFVVVGVAGNVLTITGGSNYTLTNNPISANSYSRQASPLGYPGSFDWVPAYTGFSANPTTNFAKFWVVGNQVTVNYFMNALGTSNATTFTITLPVAGLNAENAIVLGMTVDSGAPSNNNNGAGNLAGAVLSVFQNATGTAFTATGNKGLYHFTISYIF